MAKTKNETFNAPICHYLLLCQHARKQTRKTVSRACVFANKQIKQ